MREREGDETSNSPNTKAQCFIHENFSVNFLSVQTAKQNRKGGKKKRKIQREMSHAVFQTAQIMPINTQLPAKPNSLSSAASSPKFLVPNQLVAHPVGSKLRRRLVVKAYVPPPPPSSSSSGLVDGDSIALLERCFFSSSGVPSSSSLGPVMKGQYGAFGAVTLEKGKVDTSQKQSTSSPEVSFL